MAVETSETERPLVNKTTILYAARGPVLVVAVVISLLLPYIQEYCTPYVLLHLALAGLGFLLLCRDASTLLESILKAGLNLALDKIVVDDVLRAIYDPITGLYACCVGTYVGASSMYGLGMDEHQRTELLQSSLGLKNEQQAHDVLLAPGGCKRLFPVEVQNWLQSAEESNSADCIDEDGENKSICSGSTIMDAQETFLSEESSSDTEELNHASCHESIHDFEPINPNQTRGDSTQVDPVTVFFKILQRMAQSKLKSCAKALPRSRIETLGLSAAVACGIQLALGRKKSHLLTKISAGVFTLSLGTILSREAILGNVYDRQTLQAFGRELAIRILDKIKTQSASYKSVVAMLVLIVSCRRKQVSAGGYSKENFV